MERETAMKILKELHDKSLFAERTAIETIIPELKESKDEKIRNALIRFHKSTIDIDGIKGADIIAWLERQGDKDKLIKELGKYKVKYTQEVLEKHINSMSNKDDKRLRNTTISFLKDFADKGYENAVECIDWLEKQESFGEIVSRCKASWYNEGKIQGQIEGLSDEEKYQQGWHDALEKQGTPAKLSEEEQNSFAKGVLSNCALSFINYLDAHSYEGKMCVSNGECEDIDYAFHNAMWDRLHRYYCKYIEKQGSSSVKWQKNTPNYKPAINHSVLMKTTQGIAEGEWQGEDWFQYRWSWTLKDSDVLAWMELSNLDKQGEQKPAVTDFNAKDWYVSKVDGKIHNIYYSVDKVEPKFKVKYAGSEYNVLEVKDIAGVTFYGIEDEPNHIDYVKAENCEIISGYALKENGSPYPTKPAVFSEQDPAWSDEDENMLVKIIEEGYLIPSERQWLKFLKDRITWKPSKKQMKTLEYYMHTLLATEHKEVLFGLYNDLKKL